MKLTDFVKSLIIELIVAIIITVATYAISPYIPSLVEMNISLSMLVIITTIIVFGVSAIYTVQINRIKRVKPSKEGAKKFSCLECGEPFEAFPPDDQHAIGSLDPSPTAIKITYECVNHHKNTIYWLSTKGVLLT